VDPSTLVTVQAAAPPVGLLVHLPPMRFHDLRHACASLLLVQGVHPRVVMETLGHSQISLTMDTYSHVIPALQREAADRMEAVLAGLA
jgi:integrase